MNELSQGGNAKTPNKTPFAESFLKDANHDIDMIVDKLVMTSELHDRLRKSLRSLCGEKISPVQEDHPEAQNEKSPDPMSFQLYLSELRGRLSSLNTRIANLNEDLNVQLNNISEFI